MALYSSGNKSIIRGGTGDNHSSRTIISPSIYDAYSTQNNIARDIKAKSDIIGRIRTKRFRVRRQDILKFKNIGDMLISRAKKESSKIYSDMIENAQVEIVRQKVASKVQGYKEGFEEGKTKAMEEVERKKDELIGNAMLFYNNAKKEADEFIHTKEEEIKELIFSMVSRIIRRQLNDSTVLNDIIYDSIKNIKDKKPVLIKCNEINYKDISSEVISWKEKSGILGDFHVVISKEIGIGEFLIERSGGIIKYDLDDNMETLRNIIFGQDKE